MKTQTETKYYYWLAINGASCAMSSTPMPMWVRVSPRPHYLLGYRTYEEAKAYQEFFLDAPIKDIKRWWRKDFPIKIKRDEIVMKQYDQPEPPTTGSTLWMCDSK
jgi:hypothetical protein